WVLGGIQTPSWPGLALLALLLAAAVLLALRTAPGLALLGLGEAMAHGFGLDVRRFVALCVLVGAIVVAIAVAYGGLVAFVGLAAPH
ncbi:iron chelate uptake ABC transporter family permease subunit, partial [Stenotrophomonas maltophilia]|uniref:iron chelate uptake ABC transporter family permease subunit n=1 Tax=Stenotrophomonas maltophilia TaxID=40324 RepID=UPI0013DBD170